MICNTRSSCFGKISIFDTQFALLTRFNTQFADFLKYNIPLANSFNSRVFIIFSQFLWFSFSFSFYSLPEKNGLFLVLSLFTMRTPFHREDPTSCRTLIQSFYGGCKMKMKRKIKRIEKTGWKTLNRKNSRAGCYISKGLRIEYQIMWGVRIECQISTFLLCFDCISPINNVTEEPPWEDKEIL